jgi:MerR family transcriptional regulator, heat shock protein HspR
MVPKRGGRAYYMISAVAQKYNIHPQTLRLYEREGLLKPSRTEGNTRLYSEEDLEQLETILSLTRDLGVNLAGVEIILKMRRRMTDMQRQIEDLVTYVRDGGGGMAPTTAGGEPREALVRAASSQLTPVDLF